MKLRLLTNPEAILSERRNGHLELVHTLQKERVPHVFSKYIFQVRSPDSGIESFTKKGTWKDFLQCVDIIGFQSGDRKLILNQNEDDYILAIANIAPIIVRGDIGKFQNFYLLLPKGSEKAILIANENNYYNEPTSRAKSLQGTFF